MRLYLLLQVSTEGSTVGCCLFVCLFFKDI
jgi:hypothetical protein